MNPLSNIIRSAVDADRKLNILVAPFNGYFEDSLRLTGHNIFVLPGLEKYRWDTNFIKPFQGFDLNAIPIDMDFDLIICNERLTQYQLCAQVSDNFHIPLLIVDHMNLEGMVSPIDIDQIARTQRCDGSVNVANSIKTSVLNKYFGGSYIPYCTPLYESKPKENAVLIVGNFEPTELQAIGPIIQHVDDFYVVNNNTQFGPNPCSNPQELDELYAKCNIYINLTMHNYISPHMIKAMANRCAIISNRNITSKDILTENNSIICDTLEDFHRAIIKVQGSKKVYDKLTDSAFEMVEKNHNVDDFKVEWNHVLHDVCSKTYIRG